MQASVVPSHGGARPGQRPIGVIVGGPSDANGCCVYFALDHVTGLIKIGKSQTQRLLERTRELERKLGRPVTLMAYVPGGWSTERMFHKAFRSDRSRREWFRPSKQMDDAIKGAIPAPDGITYWGEWLWFLPPNVNDKGV